MSAMKKYIQLIVILVLIGFSSYAQLAHWSVGTNPSFTNFPTNNSGQINGFCRITQIKFHPTNQNKFYATTAEGGLFTTEDAGTNWTVSTGTEFLTGSTASICVDYTNDQVMYLGTGDPNYYTNGQGIYRTTNGGVSFTATSLTNCLVVEILQDPSNSGTFLAATNKGMYKSMDNGATWIATTAITIPFCDLKENAAANSPILFACTNENATRFYRSADFGSTWTQITNGIITAVAHIQTGARIGVTPADPNVVYLEAVGGGGIVHKSTDGGLSFTVMKPEGAGTTALPFITFYDYNNNNGLGGQGNYNNCMWVDVANPSRIWVQSHDTWLSNDDGVTWTEITHWSTRLHTDMHWLQQSPWDASKLYSCNDGGVWVSTDGGNNWTPKSNGLYAYEVANNAGKSCRTNRDYIIIGTQDNARIYRDATGWYTINGGDDYENKEYDYLPNGGYYYNKDHNTRTKAPGISTTTYGLPASKTKWQAIAFNRTNPDVGFLGDTNIYRSTNLSATTPTWTQISSFSKTIMAVHSCIADINRLYVITSDQKIYMSSDAMSATPTFTMYALPSACNTIASIVAIANNANNVYISINNKVYVSINGGSTWTNITYNLPSVNHRRILAEEIGGTSELVFIATNNAVYYKKAGQTTWTIYSTNLPGRRAPTDFSMYDDGTNRSLIRYATYGRAIWESPFDNLREYKAQIAVIGDSTLTCTNPTIQFADGSTGTINTPLTYVWSFPGGTPASSNASSQIVSYPSTGTYDITLSITDALNNTSTKTISKYIQVITCTPDTIPGSAISIQGTTNYVTTTATGIGTTNTVTLSSWIKIDATQPSYAGIIMTVTGGYITGLNFKDNNQLGYHYKGLNYSWTGGPTVPTGQWVHVALVLTATNATIYMNGVPYVNSVANTAADFTSGFNLGNYPYYSTRTMTGLMDEVCIYNRALSQNEIRELMHLTKNYNTVDPALKAYYQCNETGSTIYDRASTANASLLGAAIHVISAAPVGSGNSERQNITSNGIKTFANEGISLNFGTGSLPNGEVCVTRLNVKPYAIPTGSSVVNTASKYWIINNYGTNSAFAPLINLTATGFGNITPDEAANPLFFQLLSRGTGDFTNASWVKGVNASSAISGTEGIIGFNGSSISSFNKQFTIVKNNVYVDAGADVSICNGNSTAIGIVGNPAFTYSWSPSTGLSSTSISNPTASPAVSTTYTLTATNPSLGTTISDNVTINIIPPMISPVTINPTPSSSEICMGGSVNLVASGGIPPSFLTSGTGTSVTTGNSTGSALGPNPLQNFYGGAKQLMLLTAAELSAMGLNGGNLLSGLAINLATANTTYGLLNLQVKIQNTSLTALSSFVSSGWTVVRTAATYAPSAPGWNTIPFNTNYTWDGSSNLLIEINFSNNNGGTTSTNSAYFGTTSMVSTLFYRADSKTAAVMDAYSGAPSYSYSSRNNIRFMVGGTTTYSWLPNNGLDTSIGSIVTASPSATTTYSVTASFPGSCPTFSSQPVTVHSVLPVSIMINPSANPVLTGTSVTFSVNANNGGSSPLFQWQVNGLNLSTGDSYTYIPTNNDSVKCILTSSETCTSGNPAVSNTVLMNVQNMKTLHLKLFLQGLYAGSGTMNKTQGVSGDQYPGTIADQVTIELHYSTPPYNTAYTFNNINLNMNGSLEINDIPGTITGSYFVGIKHRNSIETWSATPVDFSISGIINFDITTAISQAFGDNMKLIGSDYVIYGGDINQDGIVDSGDMISVDNDAKDFLTGYINTDINGDGLIDSGDKIIVDNNSEIFLTRITP
jgi:photosystem II stability/assembly factor-like uncharacterized protein